MKRVIVLSLFILLGWQSLRSQSDSLRIQLEVGLRGRWQSGNLNQLGLNPHGKLLLANSHQRSDWQATYQYLTVEGFAIISDFWLSGFHAFQPNKRIHPLAAVFTGFAKSYKITESLVSGVGAEVNIHQASAMNFLRMHLFAGYMHVTFQQELPHTALAIGSGLRSAFPLGKRLQVIWELDTYHSSKEVAFWGANHRLILLYPIFKGISFNLSHTTIFNNKTFPELKKTNTLMLFGIQFNHSSIKF